MIKTNKLVKQTFLILTLILMSLSTLATNTQTDTSITVDTLNATYLNINGYSGLSSNDIGSTVQAYDADLADLADGTLSKSKVEDSTNWDNAYTWANANHTNWDTAFDWGNHASQGYITIGVATLTNYYLKSEIDSQGEMETIWGVTLATDTELAGQDECSEITGCIEGAYNSEANLTTLLDDNYVDVAGDTMTGDLAMSGNAITNTSTLWETSQDGLVLDMSFSSESISGTTVMDSSPYQNDGTNNGATLNESCNDLGFCDWYEFDGVDDYVDVGNIDFTGINEAFSLSLYIGDYTTKSDGTRSTIINKLISSGDYNGFKVYTYIDSDILDIQLRENSGSILRVAYNDFLESNIFITLTYDGSKTPDGLKLYKNSNLIIRSSITSNNLVGSFLTTETLKISDLSNPFNGSIDEVRIYNRSLSAAEIKSLYEQRAKVHQPYAHRGEDNTFYGSQNFDSNTLYVDAVNDRVGIGENSPSAKLDVVGDVEVNGNIITEHFTDGATYLDRGLSYVEDKYFSSGNPDGATSSNVDSLLFRSEKLSPVFVFETNSTENSQELNLRFIGRDDSDTFQQGNIEYIPENDAFNFDGGNVGIGKNNPKTKLDVDGIIKTAPRSSATCNTDSEGGIYYDSDDNTFYGCNSTDWIALN